MQWVKSMSESTSLARLKELLPQLFQPIQISGDSYLRFQLTSELPALLSMTQVQEAVLVPANAVTPLPNMPAFVLGLMSSRDRVFCVVDLAQLLELPPMPLNLREYQVVSIYLPATIPEETGGKCLGLAVRRVRGSMRFEAEQLQPVFGEFPECLTPYLSGCMVEAEERTLVLDTTAIATSPALLKNLFSIV
jgi:twitching motility protein PilI